MNMTTYKKQKRNSKVKNIKKASFIKYKLDIHGLKQVDIAADLGITEAAVCRAIYDESKITRVDNWLIEKLGSDVVNF